MRGHKLLTKELRESIPALYTFDGEDPENVPVAIKFFSPYSGWRWYATEFDGEDTFFGYVEGFSKELGYFSLTELDETEIEPIPGLGRVPAVERDLYFGEHNLGEFYDPDRGGF